MTEYMMEIYVRCGCPYGPGYEGLLLWSVTVPKVTRKKVVVRKFIRRHSDTTSLWVW